MAKQTFSVGQVLTAAQLTSLQQTAMGGGAASAKTASYTLVAADAGTTISMTSTSATTITVNTGLFAAGDTVFIQNLGSGNCTVTAGTATVSTAGSLILPTNDAGILYFVSTGVAVFYDFIQVGATSPLTTKGDLYTFSSSDARLPVGTNGYTLVADSAEVTGLKWAAPATGATFVGCILDNTTDISVSSSTSTLLTYDTETADTNAFHSTSSNTGRITIPSGYAGKYSFIGSIESSVYNLSTNSGLTSVALRKNGSSIANAFQGNLAGYNTKVCVSWVDVASVGDYYELYAYQNTGATRTIYYNKLYLCQFAAYYLG